LDGKRQEYILDLHDARVEHHTADWILEKINQTLDMYNLDASMVASFTSDAGSNIKLAIKNLGVPLQVWCAAHLLQRSVVDLLDSKFSTLFGHIRELVAFFKRSGVG
jgi:hypothetical protein